MANQTARRGEGKGAAREALAGYLFISPWIVGFLLFMGGPILFSLGLSFTKWDVVSGLRGIEYVGLQNFRDMAQDPRLVKATWNTLVYMLISVPLTMALGVLVALLMNQKLKGIAIFRTIFYLPSVTAGVASAFLWFFIFHPDFGLLNYSLRQLTHLANYFIHFFVNYDLVIRGPQWLSDPNWVKPAFVIMSLWGVGSSMVIYLAGLQAIPEQLYEAADIDGASVWQQFLNVTLPMLSPVIFFNFILTIINSFQIFTPAFVLNGGTGGINDSALFYVLYVYQQAFNFHHYGYASALAWALFLVILLVTLLQFKFSGWVYYEGESR